MSFISLPDAGGNAADWLIFFSSLPSKPVGNRVKVWRKLTKSGAVRLKGSVYVLPAGDEQVEFLNRLVAEVVGMSGEAAFVRVEKIEAVPDAEIIDLFKVRKESDYRAIGERLEALEGPLMETGVLTPRRLGEPGERTLYSPRRDSRGTADNEPEGRRSKR